MKLLIILILVSIAPKSWSDNSNQITVENIRHISKQELRSFYIKNQLDINKNNMPMGLGQGSYKVVYKGIFSPLVYLLEGEKAVSFSNNTVTKIGCAYHVESVVYSRRKQSSLLYGPSYLDQKPAIIYNYEDNGNLYTVNLNPTKWGVPITVGIKFHVEMRPVSLAGYPNDLFIGLVSATGVATGTDFEDVVYFLLQYFPQPEPKSQPLPQLPKCQDGTTRYSK